MIVWWWSHDERGEKLLNAQEVYKDMIENPRVKPNEILIEGIEKFFINDCRCYGSITRS
jgi:hypothetical protein